MGESVFRGPAYSIGSVIDGRVEPMDGPGLTYQGDALPDPRFWASRKDGMYPGRVPCFLNSPYFVLCDNIPQAASTTALVNAQTAVASTAFTVAAGASAQANGTTAGTPTMSPGVPLIPLVQAANGSFGWTGAAVTALALDFGFTTGNPVSGSNSMVVNDATLFYLGQWIAIGGAGNSGKTAPMVCYVSGITLSTNTLTLAGGSLNGVAAASVTNAPIGSMNLSGPVQPLGAIPNTVQPYLVGGLGTFLNPPEAISRCLSVTAAAGATVTTITIRGYDVFSQAMSQAVAVTAGGVAYTTKAFKYFSSAIPNSTDAGHTYSIGITDTYGYAVRSDKWEYTQTLWNGAFFTASTGWTASVKTNPATSTTGDVRGTFETSTPGAGSAGSATASNGTTVRLMMAMTVPLYNDLFATPINTLPLMGVLQV